MEAVAWTAIPVLAAVAFGNVWWLGSRIDVTNARIDGNRAAFEAGIARLEAQLAAHLEDRPRGT